MRCVTASLMLIFQQYSRSRTLPGSAAAALRLLCRAALCPATQWLRAWHLTPTLPAGCLIFWEYRVPQVTWGRLTWAACLEDLLAWLEASTLTISTWTPTASPPASPLCAWKPKSTVQPYLGPHDVLTHAGWRGTLLTPEKSKQSQNGVRGGTKIKATVATFKNAAIKLCGEKKKEIKIWQNRQCHVFGGTAVSAVEAQWEGEGVLYNRSCSVVLKIGKYIYIYIY